MIPDESGEKTVTMDWCQFLELGLVRSWASSSELKSEMAPLLSEKSVPCFRELMLEL